MELLDISTRWEEDGSLIESFEGVSATGMETITARKNPFGMVSVRVNEKTVLVLSQVELRTLRRILFEMQS